MAACPTCKREVEWSSSPLYRPFCSERCKLIDLGAWASEKHIISTDINDGAEFDSDGNSPAPVK